MLYRSRYPRSFKKKQRETIPKLINYGKLQLNDLLKLRRSCEAFVTKKKSADAENEKIIASNDAVKQKNTRNRQTDNNYLQQNITPLVDLLRGIDEQLYHLRSGLVSKLLLGGPPIIYSAKQPSIYNEDRVYFGDRVYKIKNTDEGRNLVAQHKQASEKLKRVLDGRPSFEQLRLKDYLPWPANSTVLNVNGSRMLVSLGESTLDEVNILIELHRSRIEKQKELILDIKARAATKELETRKLAQNLRRKLNAQLTIADCCPYCAGRLSLNDAHLDHIYPVSKGGQSRPKNLVLVCSSCNMKKRNSMLRLFIEEQGFSEREVYNRLIALSKEF
jgi:HNH endonuclease